MLIDAGADTTSPVRAKWKGGLEFNAITPLVATTLLLHRKIAPDGKPATEEQLHRLDAIHRLLLRVEAVHAVSWSWPSDAPFTSHAAEGGPEPRSPALREMLPILKRRTKIRGGLAAAFLRYSEKP
ncbi:unnamed protein product [Ectocarpus fasciculatus]